VKCFLHLCFRLQTAHNIFEFLKKCTHSKQSWFHVNTPIHHMSHSLSSARSLNLGYSSCGDISRHYEIATTCIMTWYHHKVFHRLLFLSLLYILPYELFIDTLTRCLWLLIHQSLCANSPLMTEEFNELCFVLIVNKKRCCIGNANFQTVMESLWPLCMASLKWNDLQNYLKFDVRL